MSGNGFYKQRGLRAGAVGVREINLIWEFCFAMEIRVLAKLTLGNSDEPKGVDGRTRADNTRC